MTATCPHCRRPHGAATRWCPDCLATLRARAANKKAMGVCAAVSCRAAADPGRTLCAGCRVKRAGYDKAWQRKLKGVRG